MGRAGAVNRAAIDIGTNTVRLLVLDEHGSDLERRYVVTGLGRGVDGARAFRADAVRQSIDVLAEYRATIERLGEATIRAIATSATRDATNGEVLLDEAEAVLGVRPEVASGVEEAELAFLGGTRDGPGIPPLLVIDVGGGSTEFVYGADAPDYATSVDMGSVRLTERRLPDRPATVQQISAARLEADREFTLVELPGDVTTGIGVGGTFTTLATLSRALPYRTWAHGLTLSRDDVAVIVGRLAALTLEGIAALESVDPARAPVALGGAIVVERAMEASGLEEVLVSEHDLLDGIALSIDR